MSIQFYFTTYEKERSAMAAAVLMEDAEQMCEEELLQAGECCIIKP